MSDVLSFNMKHIFFCSLLMCFVLPCADIHVIPFFVAMITALAAWVSFDTL